MLRNKNTMGYYRKGHFKKNGTWVSGHYVSTFGGKRYSKKNPQGCVIIIFGGIISLVLYLLK